jgi:CO/xanthine dehydrogenase Mo-binding subunit
MEASVFLEDIYPHHLLYAVTIRSPIANGLLKFVAYPKLPANYFIITARNIPGKNRLEETSVPILAENRLSYIGEPVAILLGPDKTKLEELASGCEVIADEENAVFFYEDVYGRDGDEPAAARELEIGDPGGAFAKSGKILTGSFITEIQDHWYAEPVGAVSWYKKENEKDDSKTKKPEKTLIVRTATQWPYHVKRSVAGVLGMEQSDVSVEPTSLSLHMDGKLAFVSLVACHAALGTFLTKRPVRLILNREESFLYSPKRCKSDIDIASIIDEKGNISATRIEIVVNTGAYGVNAQEILDQVCLGAVGFYNFDNLKLNARAVKTNIPPQGPFSGFGLAQGFFAMERHVSQVAESLNQDPAEWRIKNADSRLIVPSGTSGRGNIPAEELIGAPASMRDYYRKWTSYELLRQSRKGKPMLAEKEEDPRGIGIALGFQGNGLLYSGEDKGNYSIEVTLTKESILEIKTSITSSNGDYERIWAKTAAETMSIEPGMVKINTANAPDCGPSCASRNITAVTKLVEKCCLAIRKQRFHDPLPITVRRSIKPQSGSLWNGRFLPPDGKVLDINSFSKPGMAAAVVEVSIDLIECIPKIRGVWLGINGGKIVSINRAKRSLTRGTLQALGWTFTENIAYSGGILPLEQYNNYTIPIPAYTPPININFLSEGSGEPRGIGELPFTCIPAAFLQAVSQAMDHSFKTIPLNRKEIWNMVRLRNAETPAQGTK